MDQHYLTFCHSGEQLATAHNIARNESYCLTDSFTLIHCTTHVRVHPRSTSTQLNTSVRYLHELDPTKSSYTQYKWYHSEPSSSERLYWQGYNLIPNVDTTYLRSHWRDSTERGKKKTEKISKRSRVHTDYSGIGVYSSVWLQHWTARLLSESLALTEYRAGVFFTFVRSLHKPQ